MDDGDAAGAPTPGAEIGPQQSISSCMLHAGKMKANGMPQARQQVTTDEDSDDDDESGEC
eukprot:1158965-Pelagomonas_calceolata.AAC.5